jgi:hypothetical protein
MGLGAMAMAFVSAECGRTAMGAYVLNCHAPDKGNMHTLLHHASAEQKERYLRPLCAGQVRSCFAMTEPEMAGSDPTGIRTTAVRDGDAWIINGHKWFISGARGAAFAIVISALGSVFLSVHTGCVFPVRHRLPEVHARLLDGGVPLHQAKVGHSWGWIEKECEESLQRVSTDAEGQFVLSPRSSWGVGVITPIPDYGRPGWQLCIESPDGRRRYFKSSYVGDGVVAVTCDLARADDLDPCY